METSPLTPVVLDLLKAQNDPFLSLMFDQVAAGAAVVTDITAESEDALKGGRVTVHVRGL